MKKILILAQVLLFMSVNSQTTIDSLIVVQPSCGSANGELTIQATTTSAPLQYSINGGINYQTTNVFLGVASGSYDLHVRNSLGQIISSTLEVSGISNATIDNVITNNPSCYGSSDGSITLSLNGDSRPFAYSINGGLDYQSDSTFTDLRGGNYQIIIRDTNDCILMNTTTLVDTIQPEANFSVSSLTGSVPLTVNTTNLSTGALTYEWFSSYDKKYSTVDSSDSFLIGDIGNHPIRLVAFNGVCSDTLSIFITVLGEVDISAPNIFTPNGDGLNDIFKVETFGISNLKTIIYNRWGDRVYFWEGKNGAWDGFTRPSGQKVPTGVYYYTIRAQDINGETHNKKGRIHLIR